MSPGAGGHKVDPEVLTSYATNLDHYNSEADKFGDLIADADVTDESWGLIGLAVKQTYTEKLEQLKELLGQMKEGVGSFQEKLNRAAEIYDGNEKDAVMTFGNFETTIDGPQ